MPTTAAIPTLAREIKQAQDKAQQIAPFSSRGPFDLATAYAVADVVHRERVSQGARPVGRKIGFTNPEMWALYGVREPVWAHVYDTTVVHLAGENATCSLGRFCEPKIEPEVILHFCAVPPPGRDVHAILACIDWIAHGFEIVQSHFPGWKFQAADTVADWALHATLLVGKPKATSGMGPDLIADLERFTVSLFRNGALREQGTGANVLGSPLLALAHLISVLEKQPSCQPLQAGELVTTGTLTAAQPVFPGERWRTEVRGIALPGLSVEFVP